MKSFNKRYDELAPCGVFCEACPSYLKTCNGCSSDNKNQSRRSKWSCKIRTCCYKHKKYDYCIDCEEFPCNLIEKKLLHSHPADPRFIYRHEIPEIFPTLKSMTTENYLNYQKQRWKCNSCGGVVQFYLYKCSNCGKEHFISN